VAIALKAGTFLLMLTLIFDSLLVFVA
jgi:hypothetical protein